MNPSTQSNEQTEIERAGLFDASIIAYQLQLSVITDAVNGKQPVNKRALEVFGHALDYIRHEINKDTPLVNAGYHIFDLPDRIRV